jgi:uncharacterized integral membrane protein
MARFLGWIIGGPLTLLLVMFAAANRHDVRLELWPLPWSLDLPAYLAVLGALALGLALGLIIAWSAGHRARRAARIQRRRADRAESRLTAAGPTS